MTDRADAGRLKVYTASTRRRLRPAVERAEKRIEILTYLALRAKRYGITGKYFAESRQKTSTDSAYDTAITARLRQVSADLVGVPARTSTAISDWMLAMALAARTSRAASV